MSSNKKVFNYKVSDLNELYNFGIELNYIRNHLKFLKFSNLKPDYL